MVKKIIELLKNLDLRDVISNLLVIIGGIGLITIVGVLAYAINLFVFLSYVFILCLIFGYLIAITKEED